MQAWIDGYKGNISVKSYDRYSGIVKGHIIPSIGKIPLSKLAPQHIQKIYADKLDSGLSPRSQSNTFMLCFTGHYKLL